MNHLRYTMVLVVVACGHQAAISGDASNVVVDARAPDARDAFVSDAAPPDGPPIDYACAPTATPGHQLIDCPQGVTMDVEISAACAEGGCGIIFDVPGFTMSADVEDTHTRMRLLAPPLGYVVVQ